MLNMSNFALIFQNLFSILAGIVGIGFLIGFHELGHFFFCKLFKIKTPSFSIGFGPRIFSKQYGDTLFSLSAIPFGGYVEIAGAIEPGQGEQKEALANDEFSFAQKPYWQKMCVMGGGILFNIMFAYIVFIGLHLTGIPANNLLYTNEGTPVIAQVEKDSPAQRANLMARDTIISLGNTQIATIKDALTFIQQNPEKTIPAKIKRADTLIDVEITLGKNQNTTNIGFLGVSFESNPTPAQPLFVGINNGISMTHTWIKNTIMGFAQLIQKKDTANMAGPIAIVGIAAQSAKAGIKLLLILLAIISINLAVLNVIPLPILDGGQALIYTIEALLGRSIPIRIREGIHIITWIAFIILFVYLSTKDLSYIFGPYIKNIYAYFSK